MNFSLLGDLIGTGRRRGYFARKGLMFRKGTLDAPFWPAVTA
jgi:hypothetical protein